MTILCCAVSGVLAATGLYILPYRRKVIKRDFRTAIDRVRPASKVFSTSVRSVWAVVVADAPPHNRPKQIREQLNTAVTRQMELELDSSLQRMKVLLLACLLACWCAATDHLCFCCRHRLGHTQGLCGWRWTSLVTPRWH